MAESGSAAEDRRTIVIARLRRPWGRRGELIADLYTDWPEQRFRAGARVELSRPGAPAEQRIVSGFRTLRTDGLIAFEGVTSIDEARPLAGALVLAPEARLPEMSPGDVHASQLVGLRVETAGGEPIGRVLRLEEGAGQDRLVVELEGGERIEVPFVDAICTEVDLPGGRLVVELPLGLVDPDEAVTVRPERG